MKDVTSLCAVEVMSDPAAVLFGLEDEFRVLLAERTGPDAIKVVVELTAWDGPCPGCGVVSRMVKQRSLGLLSTPAEGSAGVGAAGAAVVAKTAPRLR